MFNRFLFVWVAFVLGSTAVRGAEEKGFPAEPAYQALYAQALNMGYPDIAQGVAVFRQYRSGVEKCVAEQNSASAKAFGEFLDSVVNEFQGYLNSPNLRNRQVRNAIASYVTECTALIETYAREKAKRFNSGASRLDAQDESLVATCRQLHSRMASLLRVGAPSVEGSIRQWSQADMKAWMQDGRFGKAAASIVSLGGAKEAYCRAI